MTEINQDNETSSPENQNKKKQDRRKSRQKWGDAETSLLVEGLYKHGVGNWKKILTDPKYPFPSDRTAVDLKDRFRTIYPNEYEKLYGKKAKRKKIKANDDDDDSLSDLLTFVRKPHRSKNKFTPEEDNALKLGVEKYGNSWSRIASDQQLNLIHRTGQDLRDRCRVAFPETYARFIKSRKSNYIEQPDSQILKKFYALPFRTLQKSESPDV